MNRTTGNKAIVLTVCIFAAMAVLGLSDNLRGAALPRIQFDFDVSEFHIGLILATNSLGYLIACAYTARLSGKIGIRVCLAISLLLMVIAGVMISQAHFFLFLLLSFFVLNLGCGMMDVSANVIISSVYSRNIGTMMNLTHFFYGAGAIFSPMIAVWLMFSTIGGQELGWRYMYLIVLSIALIPAMLALFTRMTADVGEKKKRGFLAMLKDRNLCLVIVIITLGCIAEAGIAAWLIAYLERAHYFESDRAALALTAFFVVYTATRLLAGPLIDKIGVVNSLILMTGIATVMLVSGVLLGISGVPLLITAGIGIAPIYPTVMAALSKLYPERIDIAISVVVTVMGIVLVPANLVIGAIITVSRSAFTAAGIEAATLYAYSAGIMFMAICGLGAALAAIFLRKGLMRSNQLI